MDWAALFALDVPLAEIVVRGTAIYWFLFLVFRLVLRRDVGSLGIADVLLLVLIADASQNGMSGDYRSITSGFVLMATLVFWNVLLDWLTYLFPPLEKLLRPSPLLLIRNGVVLHGNRRRELVTMEDLQSKLREHGVERIAEVRRAYMESDGTITVIKQQAP